MLPFYLSLEGVYEKAVNGIIEIGLVEKFEERCRRIVADTSNIGWGFHDTLSDIFEEAFND